MEILLEKSRKKNINLLYKLISTKEKKEEKQKKNDDDDDKEKEEETKTIIKFGQGTERRKQGGEKQENGTRTRGTRARTRETRTRTMIGVKGYRVVRVMDEGVNVPLSSVPVCPVISRDGMSLLSGKASA